ncbi:MAG: hypothetical protein IPK18_05790 [Sphingobacteriales bacterium]|nr:MAG: hypothetical protein IPK18_05790 [Sphingobacteriales bacterium]
MLQHPIVLLVQNIESLYPKEIQKHFSIIKKQRSEKLYKLIAQAKNDEQLEKTLLFRKLFGKAYTEKNDYLWRNEIRLLKEELESFLIQKEHEFISKNNEAYNQWLLVQAYDKMKYLQGITEKYESLVNEKHEYASYHYALDAQFILLQNLQHITPDVTKRMEAYPKYIETWKELLKDSFAVDSARINLSIAQFNWLCNAHQTEIVTPALDDYFTGKLNENNLSVFFNNFGKSYYPELELKLASFDKAIKAIEIVTQKNALYNEHSIIIQMALGKELSSNGHFAKAHEILSKIKPTIDKDFAKHRTVFYVNYVTNLVKNKMFKEALYVLEHEFTTDNQLYKNMLLQSRLLCYLYLKDIDNLSTYISFDLDTAPFPQNYMLKVIKSAYFYLLQEYDTALSIINSLIQPKFADGIMKFYNPITLLYKKLYTITQKNVLQKNWSEKDVQALQTMIIDFEATCDPEIKLVSIYTWLKIEIEINIAKKQA